MLPASWSRLLFHSQCNLWSCSQSDGRTPGGLTINVIDSFGLGRSTFFTEFLNL